MHTNLRKAKILGNSDKFLPLSKERGNCEDNIIVTWSGQRGSNPRPLAWEASVLPTELCPHAK